MNLTHEEALIEYDPTKVTSIQLKETLLDLGYTVRDARKVRTFEEEAELRRDLMRSAEAFQVLKDVQKEENNEKTHF